MLSLARRVREKTQNGDEILRFYLSIMRGEPLSGNGAKGPLGLLAALATDDSRTAVFIAAPAPTLLSPRP
jgi:hypothetical protein